MADSTTQNSNISQVVPRKLTGRKTIYTDYDYIDSTNVVEVIQKAMLIHSRNVRDIRYLKAVERGEQDILYRVKEVRPEINHKIVENHAHEITEFKDGYVFGSPITYVQRSNSRDNDDGKTDDDSLQILNEMLFEQMKSSKDQELANTFNITGIAYRGVFANKDEDDFSCFKIVNLDPETTFVIRTNDIYKRILAGVSYRISEDNVLYTYGVYTDDKYYELVGTMDGVNTKIVSIATNGIGMVPIVEYSQDFSKMGCFERGMPLIDAINLVTSDRVNGIDQLIQSLIWFNNVDIDEEQFASLGAMGGIKTVSKDGVNANIEVLKTELNQSETQTLVDYLYSQLLYICAVPTREQSTGGNTGLALTLGGSGWQLAETAAKKTEQLFAASERELIKVISRIVDRANDKNLKSIKVSDIEINFSRNKVSNVLTKTQGLLNQLSAGVHPRIALANSDLYNDPEQVWNDSKEFMEKWKTQTSTTSSSNNTGESGANSTSETGGNEKVESDQTITTDNEKLNGA